MKHTVHSNYHCYIQLSKVREGGREKRRRAVDIDVSARYNHRTTSGTMTINSTLECNQYNTNPLRKPGQLSTGINQLFKMKSNTF